MVYTSTLAIKMLIRQLWRRDFPVRPALIHFAVFYIHPFIFPPFAHQIEARSGATQFPGPHKCNINWIEMSCCAAAAMAPGPKGAL